jgi:type II secretion system protein H
MRRVDRRWNLLKEAGGFTLMELLIVLAIMVLMAGACWPMLRGVMDKAYLADAAKGLRTVLSQARLDAIDSGVPRQFRFQPGGTQYELAVYAFTDDSLLANAGGETTSDTTVRYDLPQGIQFAAPAADADDSSSDNADASRSGDEWSQAILFYPNGHSDNLRLRLSGAKGMYVEVWLRGITGVAKVGPIEREEQQP